MARGKMSHSTRSGPVTKTGGGVSHSSIPREGFGWKASDTRGDTRRDNYGGNPGSPTVEKRTRSMKSKGGLKGVARY